MKKTRPSPVSSRRRWLCIAYAFPPINRSGPYRTLGFVSHLDRLGWDATVLTVEPGDEPVDESLSMRVPASTTILRTPWTDLIASVKRLSRFGRSPHGHHKRPRTATATEGPQPDEYAPTPTPRGLREWVSRLLMTPDSRVGWVVPGVREGIRTVRRHRPDVIYSTSPYMSAHLIGLIISKRTGLPWVADFRDPWRDNPFRRLGFWSLDRWDARLERLVLRHATHIVGNTPTMVAKLCLRHPFLAEKSTTIPNGFDAEQFDRIEPTRTAPRGDFVLAHCGEFYGPRSPATWFHALRLATERAPRLAGRLRMVLIGPPHYDRQHLAALASAMGIGDCVEVLGRRSHAETLSRMAGSDAVILAGCAGPGGDLQVPNKLYEYLAIRRPVIAAVTAANPAVAVLKEARAQALICAPDDVQAIATAIIELATGRGLSVGDPWSGVGRFERGRRAAELAELFQRVIARDRPPSSRVLAAGQATARGTVPQRSPAAYPVEDSPRPGRITQVR